MGEIPSSVRGVRFGVFEVDLRSGELRKKGVKIRLQGQPYLLLVTLLKQQGEVVAREEIRRTLWPEDTFVDFDHSLGTAVNKLREVLGDSASNPRFVETIPRRGYRFIAPIEAIDEPESASAASQIPPNQEEPTVVALLEAKDELVRPRWTRAWKVSVLVVFLLSTGLIVFFIPGRPSTLIRSLAVLPL